VNEPLEVLTVGRISIDLYCGELGHSWDQARGFHRAVGGSPTNVAVAAARYGHRAAVYTKVGADPFGQMARSELAGFGVDTSYVTVESELVTPLAFAALDPPADPQLHFRRASPVPDLQLHRGEVPDSVIGGVPILWISGGALSADPSASTVESMLIERVAGCGPSGGAPLIAGGVHHTILDLDYRPSFWPSRRAASDRIGAAVEFATIAVGNREECEVAVGTADPYEAARRLLDRGVRLAIVKMGADGVLLADGRSETLVGGPRVEVLCGLGAGDAFGGALCHGLLSGWAPERCVSFANAAGGLVASRLLCSEAMPYESEVLELMEAGRDPAQASETTIGAGS
jgi:5-dehydro-2-deoxygluconokinase